MEARRRNEQTLAGSKKKRRRRERIPAENEQKSRIASTAIGDSKPDDDERHMHARCIRDTDSSVRSAGQTDGGQTDGTSKSHGNVECREKRTEGSGEVDRSESDLNGRAEGSGTSPSSHPFVRHSIRPRALDARQRSVRPRPPTILRSLVPLPVEGGEESLLLLLLLGGGGGGPMGGRELCGGEQLR